MKRILLSSSPRHQLIAASLCALACSATLSAAAADDANDAKNLARMNCGAQIECTTPDGRVSEVAAASDANQSAAALIMDDDTLSCPLQEGRTTFVIKLPSAALLDRFTFINENATAAGDLKISVSNYQLPAESEKWVDVDGHISFSRKRLFNLSMVGVEARYVKLAFNVQKAGRIAALGLYGGQSLESFSRRNLHVIREGAGDGFMRVSNKAARATLEDSLNFDFANVYARARVVYASSGVFSGARRMIDDDTTTAYKFGSADSRPLVIVELAESERLHRVSAVYTMNSGRLDVFLLEELATNPSDLRGANLIASVVDRDRKGKAAVDFDAQGARYVALRWTPEGESRGEPFEVAEINAFGDVPLSMVTFAAIPDTFASSGIVAAPPSLPSDIPALPQLPLVSP